MLRILFPIKPQALRTSFNRIRAWLARNDSNIAIGDKNGPISPYDNDDWAIKFEIAGEVDFANRIVADQDSTSNTMGMIR